MLDLTWLNIFPKNLNILITIISRLFMMKTCVQEDLSILIFNVSNSHLKHATIDALSFLHECIETLVMKQFVHKLQSFVQPKIKLKSTGKERIYMRITSLTITNGDKYPIRECLRSKLNTFLIIHR